jgi:hypothetical protein
MLTDLYTDLLSVAGGNEIGHTIIIERIAIAILDGKIPGVSYTQPK